jgi:hypothetical protein
MSPLSSVAQDVYTPMVAVYSSDYARTFKIIFEKAVRFRRAIPIEPTDEIRNAFDHFSLALDRATKIQEAGALATVAAETEEALTDVERARRHIWFGIYYCFEHLIEAQIAWIQADLNRPNMGTTPHAALSGYRQSFGHMETQYRSLEKLNYPLRTLRSDLASDISALKKKSVDLKERLFAFYRLLIDVRKAMPGS